MFTLCKPNNFYFIDRKFHLLLSVSAIYRNVIIAMVDYTICFPLHQECTCQFLAVIKTRHSNSRLIPLLNSLSSSFFSLPFFLFSIHDSLRSTAVALPGNFIPTSAPFIPLVSHAHACVNVRAEYAPGIRSSALSPSPLAPFCFFFLANSGVLYPLTLSSSFTVHLLG